MIPASDCFDPLWLEVDGVRLRAARVGAAPGRPSRGVCSLLNGQTEFIEKYFEVIDELRGRGFSVVTFDWRGQGGSDRQLPDARKAHIENFTAYDQDLDTVIRETVMPLAAQLRAQPIVMSHSM